MNGNPNHDRGNSASSPPPPRVPFFFCTECNARREAVDPGDVFPICAGCGTRSLVVRYEDEAIAPRAELTPPRDERPPEAAPYLQPKRRDLVKREQSLAILRALIDDFPAAIDAPETIRALFETFNPFVREIVNQMVIERVDWQTAVKQLPKDFCARHAAALEEFIRWASRPADRAVPAFIEPTTHHEPLSEPHPKSNPETGRDAPG